MRIIGRWFKSNFNCGTSWPLSAPRVETEMAVLMDVRNGEKDQSEGSALTITTRTHFDKSCPKGSDSPKVDIIISNGAKKNFHCTLSRKTPKTDFFRIPPGEHYAGIHGTIHLSYTYRCVYFGKESYLAFNELGHKFPLGGALIFDWCGNDPPLAKKNAPIKPIPENEYPFFYINKKINIYNRRFFIPGNLALTIAVGIPFIQGINEPEIRIKVSKNDNRILCNTILTPNSNCTDNIHIESGDYLSGFNSKIQVNYEKGCVYFEDDGDDSQSVLIKAKKESKDANDYPIRWIRIFDWKGLRLP